MLVLFDIDGTLIMTGGAGLKALERAWEDLHGHARAGEGVTLHGMTDPRIIADMFELRFGRAPSADEIQQVIDRYLVHLVDEVGRTNEYRVLPGVEAALAACEAGGATIGLATGNVKRGAEIKLTRGDLWRRFAFGGFGCDHADRARLVGRAIERGHTVGGRAFAAEETWVIGDTARDVAAAHGCGVPCIGVATGPATPDALRAAGADVVFETLDEFPMWLKGRSP
jgi:phosphoglycolate phosphatase-like HAD superfamily hydrolase